MPEIITQEELVLRSVMRYYENHPREFKCLVDIVNLTPTSILGSGSDKEKHKVSISLIEYFILKYAKKNSTMYKKTNGDFFFVYSNYKNFLKGYKKRFTDPFKRKDPYKKKNCVNGSEDDGGIQITLHNTTIRTRLAQLHFFRWVFDQELLHYIESHYQNIIDTKHKDEEVKKKRNKVLSETTPINPNTVPLPSITMITE